MLLDRVVQIRSHPPPFRRDDLGLPPCTHDAEPQHQQDCRDADENAAENDGGDEQHAPGAPAPTEHDVLGLFNLQQGINPLAVLEHGARKPRDADGLADDVVVRAPRDPHRRRVAVHQKQHVRRAPAVRRTNLAHRSLQRDDAPVQKSTPVVRLFRDTRRLDVLDAEDVHGRRVERHGAVSICRHAGDEHDRAAGQIFARHRRHDFDAAQIRMVLRRNDEAVRLKSGHERDDSTHRHDSARCGDFGRQGKYLAGPDILVPADRGEGGEHDGKDYGERSHAGIIPLIPAPLSKYQPSGERDFQARAESRA